MHIGTWNIEQHIAYNNNTNDDADDDDAYVNSGYLNNNKDPWNMEHKTLVMLTWAASVNSKVETLMSK